MKKRKETIRVELERIKPRAGVQPTKWQRDRKNDYTRKQKHKGREPFSSVVMQLPVLPAAAC